jgi:DNA-binding CsgD family transcriptional regulator
MSLPPSPQSPQFITRVVTQLYETHTQHGRSVMPDNFMDHFYFEAILSSLGAGFAIFDAVQGKIVFTTKEIPAYLELTEQEYLEGWPQIGDAQVAKEYVEDLGAVLQHHAVKFLAHCLTPEGAPRVLHFFLPLRPKSGRLKWLHQRVIPISWTADGQVLAAVLFVTDLTPMPFENKVVSYESILANPLELTFMLQGPERPSVQLNKREYQVLHLICQNKERGDIAQALGLSPNSVDKYRKDLMKKLGASKQAQLIQLSTAYNLV